MRRCRLTVLSCLIFFGQWAWAQRYDSLLNRLQYTTADTSIIKLYHLLAEETRTSNPALAIAYEDSALTAARRINSPKHIAVALTNIGSIYRNISENEKACRYFFEALTVSPPSSPWLSDTYLEAGITLLRMTEPDSAMSLLQKGISLVEEYPDRYIEASLYNAMGNVKREQNQYQEALEFYIQSTKLFEADKNQAGLAQTLSNIGNLQNLMGNTESALEYAKQSLESAKASGVRSSIAYSHRLMGQIYRRQGNADEALKMYNEAISIYHEIHSKRDLGETELSTGNIYFDKANYTEALNHYSYSLSVSKAIPDTLLMTYTYLASGITLLYTKDYDGAKAYMDTTIALSRLKKLSAPRMDSYQVLSEVYEAEGNHKEALRFYKDYISLRDSVTRVQNREQALETEARFQSERKDDAIRILNAENNLKLTQQRYLVIVVVLLLVSAGILYSRYKVKLKANQKLQELDEVKSRFFANISHEFRTPLSLILGPLEERIAKNAHGEDREKLLLMHRNAKRLQNLTNQLLDLSRIESGNMELHLEESDLANTLRFVGSAFSSMAERKGISYRQEIFESHFAFYDRDKVEKIINNLLSNAFKFTAEGGMVQYKAVIENNAAVIEIKDSGIGIPSHQLESIFNRFYQVDDSMTRVSEGSGIGLALARELAELHRGKLSVSSKEGIGSVFQVVIPISKESYNGLPIHSPEYNLNPRKGDFPQTYSTTPAPTVDDDDAKPLVLIAEDNKDMQSFISDLLKNDYRIVACENGLDAFDRAQAIVPDLVISDWMMPGMDGRTFCEKLKNQETTSHIPVLMLTARADQASKLAGLETGADDYLIKPFDSHELVVRIHNLIEQRRKLRAVFSREMTLQPKNIPLPSRDAVFLSKLLALLETKYAAPDFSVEELAIETGMSRMQLHRKVKALTDQSPGEFLRSFRLERAKQLLSTTGMQVSEVCFKVGFNSVSNFSKVFREFAGVTPTEFIVSEKEKREML